MMKSLKKLYAYSDCGIDQNGINGLDLVELDRKIVHYRITNVVSFSVFIFIAKR
jgi:hypothetical protein